MEVLRAKHLKQALELKQRNDERLADLRERLAGKKLGGRNATENLEGNNDNLVEGEKKSEEKAAPASFAERQLALKAKAEVFFYYFSLKFINKLKINKNLKIHQKLNKNLKIREKLKKNQNLNIYEELNNFSGTRRRTPSSSGAVP
jgi:hypothetical protein